MTHDHSHEHTHSHAHSHSHDHAHEHTHGHSHDHSHEHSNGDVVSSLSFEEKLIKLIGHWIQHNDGHAETYDTWAEKSKSGDLAAVGTLITEAAEITRSASVKLAAALALLKK